MQARPQDALLVAHAGGFSLWYFQTPDPAGDVLSDGYFNKLNEIWRVGDRVMVRANNDHFDLVVTYRTPSKIRVEPPGLPVR